MASLPGRALALTVALTVWVTGLGTLPAAAEIVPGSGAVLRGLDKMNGTVTDFELATGQTRSLGHIDVRLKECRYPSENPTGQAYAFLIVTDPDQDRPAFAGWMIASAPALSALEHARYDIWVLRCQTS